MRKLLSFFRMVNLIGFVQQVSSMSMEAGLVGKIRDYEKISVN